MSCPATSARPRVPIGVVHEVFKLQNTDQGAGGGLAPRPSSEDTFQLDVEQSR